jgi:hypothetical protein
MEEAAMTQWMDQQRMEPVHNANARCLARVQEDAGPVAHRLADRFFQAIDFQLMADYRYREAERVEALGLENERAQAARRAANRYNTACLEVLTDDTPSAIEEVRQRFGSENIDFPDWLAIFEQEGREQIADIDLKGEHAAIAGQTLSETIAVAYESGINGLCDRLQDQVSQLAELRRRRPEHNEPGTFVLGASLMGLAAIIQGICWAASGPGPCSNATANAFSVIFGVSGAFIILASLGLLLTAPAA